MKVEELKNFVVSNGVLLEYHALDDLLQSFSKDDIVTIRHDVNKLHVQLSGDKTIFYNIFFSILLLIVLHLVIFTGAHSAGKVWISIFYVFGAMRLVYYYFVERVLYSRTVSIDPGSANISFNSDDPLISKYPKFFSTYELCNASYSFQEIDKFISKQDLNYFHYPLHFIHSVRVKLTNGSVITVLKADSKQFAVGFADLLNQLLKDREKV